MSNGINKVILVGYIGADPEVHTFPDGNSTTKMRVATNESWQDKKTGEKQTRAEWHNVCFFGRLAEVVAQYCSQGRHVYVEGSLRTRKWTDSDGSDRYITEIIGKHMQLLDSSQAATPDDCVAEDVDENLDEDIPF